MRRCALGDRGRVHAAIGPGAGRLLLRGRRRGRRALPRRRCARPPPRPQGGRRRAAARGRRRRGRSTSAAARCASRSVFFTHRRDGPRHRPAGRARVAQLIEGLTAERRRARTSTAVRAEIADAAARAGAARRRRAPRRREVRRRRRAAGRSPRPGSRSPARTAPRSWSQQGAPGAERFTWDFIGHLQSRKVKQVLPLVRWIHSVAADSRVRAARQARAAPARRGARRGQRRRRGGQERRRARRAGRRSSTRREAAVSTSSA